MFSPFIDYHILKFVLRFRRQHSQPDLSNELSLCFDTGYNISMQEVGNLCRNLVLVKNFVVCDVVITVIDLQYTEYTDDIMYAYLFLARRANERS